MGRDKDRYEISAKRTLVIRKRRPRNVNLGICYVPSTSQTSQSDVFGMYMGLHCAIWEMTNARTCDVMGISLFWQSVGGENTPSYRWSVSDDPL
jgi:hypothetical protein